MGSFVMHTILIIIYVVFSGSGQYIKGKQTTENILFQTRRKPSRIYDPNYGYKQYWPGGDWVIYGNPDITTQATSSSTEFVPEVCGEPCGELYIPVKKICTKTVNEKYFFGCTPSMFNDVAVLSLFNSGWCYNKPVDDLAWGYTTMDSYCHFLAKDCELRAKHDQYQELVFVHVGPCMLQPEYFKPMNEYYRMQWFETVFPEKRATDYIKAVRQRFANISKTPF